ncbi:hypothetical protein [Amphibacillus jilinensis]|uniref:hypothetical protein n=1 Tax=Amphibacillus jilinensis TaxID=1216008 RepID=UPI00038271B3|nr:hypothetical protein [Amphibacillus jilinensis]
MNKRVDENLKEVKRYHQQLMNLSEEDKVERIYLLSKQLIFIGRLSTIFYEQNKRLYIDRKLKHSEQYIQAKSNKTATADIAVADLRKQEIEADINYKRWNTAFKTVIEEINALKYKVRIDIEDGSSRNNI